MTFPQRGTRTLNVNGRGFRWHVSPKRLHYGGSLATIQSSSGAGQILHYWLREGFPSPKDASDAISFALANGWDPDASGAALWIEWADQGMAIKTARVDR